MYPKGAAAKMVSFEGSEFGLPPSFPQLLFDFAKEVIRSQPEDIYQFGKEYFNCKRMVRRKIQSPASCTLAPEP